MLSRRGLFGLMTGAAAAPLLPAVPTAAKIETLPCDLRPGAVNRAYDPHYVMIETHTYSEVLSLEGGRLVRFCG
jgi:hypothetical protein